MYRKYPQHFKQALTDVGLQTSLLRMKILLALQGDHYEGLTTRQLHEHLINSGEPISLVSVRQGVFRLYKRDILVRVGRSQYRLNQNRLPKVGQSIERAEVCLADK